MLEDSLYSLFKNTSPQTDELYTNYIQVTLNFFFINEILKTKKWFSKLIYEKV